MKIGLYSDVHWSKTTSIVTQRGDKYSKRLELLKHSMDWAFLKFRQNKCDIIVCAGDFFNRDTVNDEEASALRDVNFPIDIPHNIIVGNHESSRADLQFTSADVIPNVIINKEARLEYDSDNLQLYFLPYITEYDRKPLIEYLYNYNKDKKHIIISHNDISGIQYGGFISKSGFTVDEIESCCDLYLNGHIHNGGWVTDKILNLGSLTAQNFTNDSFTYQYGVWILDTDTLKVDFIENPWSLRFYKVEVTTIKELKEIFSKFGESAVVSIKCPFELKADLEKLIEEDIHILNYRVIYTRDNVVVESQESQEVLPGSDHLEQFRNYVIQTLGSTEIVKQELVEVCK